MYTYTHRYTQIHTYVYTACTELSLALCLARSVSCVMSGFQACTNKPHWRSHTRAGTQPHREEAEICPPLAQSPCRLPQSQSDSAGTAGSQERVCVVYLYVQPPTLIRTHPSHTQEKEKMARTLKITIQQLVDLIRNMKKREFPHLCRPSKKGERTCIMSA